MYSVRYAVRSILRDPGVSAFIVCALGLGIGVNTAIFSLVNHVLFRSLPVHKPNRLMRVFSTNDRRPDGFGTSYPEYLRYQDQAASFSSLAAYSNRPVHLATFDQRPKRLTGAIVSGNYFETLGIQPFIGRLLTPTDDEKQGAHPYVVISEQLWRTDFGSKLSIIGETVRINAYPFVVVGVAPRGFAGVDLQAKTDVWVPMSMVAIAEPIAGRELSARSLTWLNIVGRLRDESSGALAISELHMIAERSTAAGTNEDPRFGVLLIPLGHGAGEDATRISWLLLTVVSLVLLIASANVSMLLLARAEKRRREFAIRLALGARGGHIVALFLFEGLILAFLGACLGVLLASGILRLASSHLAALFLVEFGMLDYALDWEVLLYCAASALLAAIFFTAAPAFRISRANPLSSLKGDHADLPGSRLSVRSALVIFQIAACTVLLLDAGLLLRSLYKDLSIDPGFSARTGLIADVDLVRQGYDKDRSLAFFQDVLENLRSTPGVSFAAVANSLPLQGSMSTQVTVGANGQHGTNLNMISSQYFYALGIPFLLGRDFDSQDRASGKVIASTPKERFRFTCAGIVNEKFVQTYWPGESPIGKMVSGVGPKDIDVQIVGVVKDVKTQSVREPAAPMLYVPVEEVYSHFPFQVKMAIIVNTNQTSDLALSALLGDVHRVDTNLPLFGIRTFRDAALANNIVKQQTLTGLLFAFGAIAVILAGIGVYGLISFVTELRTREFGIRLALGASSQEIMRLVFLKSLTLTSCGLLLGFSASLLSFRLISASLYGISPFDPLVVCLVVLFSLALALIGALGPARRSIGAVALSSVMRSE